MFSTICLLFLCGFIFWMNTSRRIAWSDKNPVMAYMSAKPMYSRYAAAALFIIATALCVIRLGAGSGLFAAVTILMAAGSVSVLFFPFQYLGVKGIGILYLCVLALELLTP
ncbi:hypothetical protein [Dyadobacter sp. Leaf189]|uniref:hypothetical protein n=1 Tax=Dyadobacter sp. Leaf189 TaxID=1736295 RepID=UPI0006FDFB1F|nr:hypothetical protein [Dyadobacter sp. Leaf189]KQS30893.1 hypothetical protein ASG33_11025 [Dyadobacter sp. Leaf189]